MNNMDSEGIRPIAGSGPSHVASVSNRELAESSVPPKVGEMGLGTRVIMESES